MKADIRALSNKAMGMLDRISHQRDTSRFSSQRMEWWPTSRVSPSLLLNVQTKFGEGIKHPFHWEIICIYLVIAWSFKGRIAFRVFIIMKTTTMYQMSQSLKWRLWRSIADLEKCSLTKPRSADCRTERARSNADSESHISLPRYKQKSPSSNKSD